MKIIVYGSFRREQGNSHWMTNGQFQGEYLIDGYELYDLGYYPALVKGEGKVLCEVYRVNATMMAELDALKSEHKGFERNLVQTPYGIAWLYTYSESIAGLKKIESGDWAKRETL